MRLHTTRRGQRGQSLPLVVGGMVAVIASAALVIDGGNAWAQQRMTQNATDSIAEAGAITLAKMWSGQTTPVVGWDASVALSIYQYATANNMLPPTGYYTDVCGTLLTPSGTAATGKGDAARVGLGMPPTTAAWPSACPASIPGPPSGVLVDGSRQFSTYLAGVVGMSQMTAGATATAVSGFLQAECDAEAGCALLPVILPVFMLQCNSNNQLIAPSPGTEADFPWPLNTIETVPLCQNGPGNVGWLDWSPPNGGTSELVDSIQHPNNPPITVPSWQSVTSTGNINSGTVEAALNAYAGQVVFIPMFDNTCDAQPTDNGIEGCPSGHWSGNGQNQWYHVAQFAAFRLCGGSPNPCAGQFSQGAYITGNNEAICAAGGNGGTSCLAGEFIKYIQGTTVVRPPSGGGSTTTGMVGVQLIR